MPLFGSSGIRGLVGSEVTADLMVRVGQALGSRYPSLIVGRDTRTSGEMLAHALAAGAMATGAEVHDAGMVSTPTLALAAARFRCGAVVTASHNPPQYNGVKLWNPDGMSFDARQREEVEGLVASGALPLAPWDHVGEVHPYPTAVEEHMRRILQGAKPSEARVVVDCACGATCNITPYVLEALGCRVLGLNCQPDGAFPGRDPEPLEENLSLLKATVKSSGATLGIAHDGDGDRMVAVDEAGRYVGGDRLLALFALREAKRRIVVPVDASMVLEDVLAGVEVIRTRVGDAFISEEVAHRGADFGGEPSGTWIFPSHSLCPDGIFAAARLLQILEGEKLSKALAAIPEYPLLRGSVPFPREQRSKVVEALGKILPSLKPREVSTVDGWRLLFDEGWVVVRPSGTEPKIRITAEARREPDARALYHRAEALVKGVVG